MLTSVLMIFAAAGSSLAPQAAPQERIPRAQSCNHCRIQVRSVVRIGDPQGPGQIVDFPSSIVQDSRNRYYVGTQGFNEAPWVFDSTGKFLRRLGRVGSGPGEFKRPYRLLVTPGDTIHVFDRGTARRTVLSPDYRALRSTPITPQIENVLFLGPGRFLYNAPVGSRDRFGLAFHFFDDSGRIVHSFGEGQEKWLPRDVTLRAARQLATGRRGRFWTSRWLYQYEIREWNSDGQLIRTLLPESDWYPAYDEMLAPTPARPPRPGVRAIWLDDNDMLWVIGATSDRNWSRGLGPEKRLEGQVAYPIEDEQKLFDGVLDVFDVRRGRLVVSQRSPETYNYFLGRNRIAAVREYSNGVRYLEVFEVQLVR